MICDTVEELTPVIGTRPACRALGASVATVYRRRRPPQPTPPRPRPTPARALSEPERERVLEVLHSERFVDWICERSAATALLTDPAANETQTNSRSFLANTCLLANAGCAQQTGPAAR